MKSLRSFLFISIITIMLSTITTSILAADSINIKAATWHPVTHRLTDDAYKVYGREISKRTNGKVKFTWILGGSLVNPFNAYDGLKAGICDWSYFISGAKPNEFYITNIVNLPFIAENASHASAILTRMYDEIPEMRKEYKRFKPLAFFSTAVVNLHTKGKAPRTLEDVKGMKIGTPGPVLVRMLKGLGSSAQQLKPGDMYTALQRGMVQGTLFADAPMRSYKLTDIISHHTMMDIGVDVLPVGMNMDKWNSLPSDVQKVFLDMREPAGALFGATLTNETEWVNEELKARGDEYYYLPADEKERWKRQLQPMYDAWIKKANKRGLNGKEIFEKVLAISEREKKYRYISESWWGRAGKK